MSDFHKEMLDRMYREIPAAEKANFLIGILKELPPGERTKVEHFLKQNRSQEMRAPESATPKATSQQPSPAAVPNQAQRTQPDIEALLQKGQDASTLTPQKKQPKTSNAKVQQPFLQPTNVKSEMRKELVLFILFAALVLAAIVGLAVGAKHLWDALLAFLGM